MLPITASGVSGIGQSATGLLEGSWVFGFFRDNSRNQEPIILGSLPGRPVQQADSTKGFNDPNGVYPKYINEPDVNRLAVNGEIQHPSLATDAASRVTGIQAYNSEWDQPASTYGAIYPYNQVYESESGHIVEFDDTPDAERIHIRHKSGTRLEITSNGDQLAIIKGTNYLIIDKDNKVYIKGNSDITVDGDANVKANGNAGILASTIELVANSNIHMSASNLNITGDVVLDGKLDVTKDLTVEGKLIVKDGSTLTGDNSIEGYQEI
jgi:phage baseplate assembly protein gpV